MLSRKGNPSIPSHPAIALLSTRLARFTQLVQTLSSLLTPGCETAISLAGSFVPLHYPFLGLSRTAREVRTLIDLTLQLILRASSPGCNLIFETLLIVCDKDIGLALD